MLRGWIKCAIRGTDVCMAENVEEAASFCLGAERAVAPPEGDGAVVAPVSIVPQKQYNIQKAEFRITLVVSRSISISEVKYQQQQIQQY